MATGVPELHLTMAHGEDWRRTLTLTTADGAPADLTGYVVEYAVATSEADAPTVTLSSATAGVTLDATTGTVTLTYAAADVAALTPGVYVHALRATGTDGAPHLVRTGTLTVVGSAF